MMFLEQQYRTFHLFLLSIFIVFIVFIVSCGSGAGPTIIDSIDPIDPPVKPVDPQGELSLFTFVQSKEASAEVEIGLLPLIDANNYQITVTPQDNLRAETKNLTVNRDFVNRGETITIRGLRSFTQYKIEVLVEMNNLQSVSDDLFVRTKADVEAPVHGLEGRELHSFRGGVELVWTISENPDIETVFVEVHDSSGALVTTDSVAYLEGSLKLFFVYSNASAYTFTIHADDINGVRSDPVVLSNVIPSLLADIVPQKVNLSALSEEDGIIELSWNHNDTTDEAGFLVELIDVEGETVVYRAEIKEDNLEIRKNLYGVLETSIDTEAQTSEAGTTVRIVNLRISGFYGVKTYSVQVRAQRGQWNSAVSTVEISTTDESNDMQVLVKEIAATATSVVIGWDVPKIERAGGLFEVPDFFQVEFVLKNLAEEIVERYVAGRTETHYSFLNLRKPSNEVHAVVIDETGNRGQETVVLISTDTIPDTIPPMRVRNLASEIVNYEETTIDVRLSWDDNEDDELAKVIIVVQNEEEEVMRFEVEGANTRQTIIEKLRRDGSSYTFLVSTADFDGNISDIVETAVPAPTSYPTLSLEEVREFLRLTTEDSISSDNLEINLNFQRSPLENEAYVIRLLREEEEVSVKILSDTLYLFRFVQQEGSTIVFDTSDGVLSGETYTIGISRLLYETGEKTAEIRIGPILVTGEDMSTAPSEPRNFVVGDTADINYFQLMASIDFTFLESLNLTRPLGPNGNELLDSDIVYEAFVGLYEDAQNSCPPNGDLSIVENLYLEDLLTTRGIQRLTRQGNPDEGSQALRVTFPSVRLESCYFFAVRAVNSKSTDYYTDSKVYIKKIIKPVTEPPAVYGEDEMPFDENDVIFDATDSTIKLSFNEVDSAPEIARSSVRYDVYYIDRKTYIAGGGGQSRPANVDDIASTEDSKRIDVLGQGNLRVEIPISVTERSTYYIGIRTVNVDPSTTNSVNVDSEADPETQSSLFADSGVIIEKRASNANFPTTPETSITYEVRSVQDDPNALEIEIEALGAAALQNARNLDGSQVLDTDIVYSAYYSKIDYSDSDISIALSTLAAIEFTVDDFTVDESQNGRYTKRIEGLSAITEYYVTAVARIKTDPSKFVFATGIGGTTISGATEPPQVENVSASDRTKTSLAITWDNLDFSGTLTNKEEDLQADQVSFDVYLVKKGTTSRSVEEVISDGERMVLPAGNPQERSVTYDGLDIGSSYEVVVETTNVTDSTKKVRSAVFSVATLRDETAPGPPRGLTLAADSETTTTLTIDWNAPESRGTDEYGDEIGLTSLFYDVYYFADTGAAIEEDIESDFVVRQFREGRASKLRRSGAENDGTGISLVLGEEDPLVPGTTYYIVAQAIYVVDNSELAGPLSDVVLVAETVSVASEPPSPINVRIDEAVETAVSENSIHITWDIENIGTTHLSRSGEMLLDNQISYLVYALPADQNALNAETLIASDAVLSEEVPAGQKTTSLENLTNGIAYDVVLVSVNDTVNSSEDPLHTPSSVVEFETLSNAAAPSAPRNVGVEAISETLSATVTWNIPENLGKKNDAVALEQSEIKYTIYYVLANEGDQVPEADYVRESVRIMSNPNLVEVSGEAQGDTQSLVLENLEGEKKYYVVVEAQNNTLLGISLATLGTVVEFTSSALSFSGELTYPGPENNGIYDYVRTRSSEEEKIQPISIPVIPATEEADVSVGFSIALVEGALIGSNGNDAVRVDSETGDISVDRSAGAGTARYSVTTSANNYSSQSAEIEVTVTKSSITELWDVNNPPLSVVEIPRQGSAATETAQLSFVAESDNLEDITATIEPEGFISVVISENKKNLVITIPAGSTPLGSYEVRLEAGMDNQYYEGSGMFSFTASDSFITDTALEYDPIVYSSTEGGVGASALPANEINIKSDAEVSYEIAPVDPNRKLTLTRELDEGVLEAVSIDGMGEISIPNDARPTRSGAIQYKVTVSDDNRIHFPVDTIVSITVEYVDSVTLFDQVDQGILEVNYDARELGQSFSILGYAVTAVNPLSSEANEVTVSSDPDDVLRIESTESGYKYVLEKAGEAVVTITSALDTRETAEFRVIVKKLKVNSIKYRGGTVSSSSGMDAYTVFTAIEDNLENVYPDEVDRKPTFFFEGIQDPYGVSVPGTFTLNSIKFKENVLDTNTRPFSIDSSTGVLSGGTVRPGRYLIEFSFTSEESDTIESSTLELAIYVDIVLDDKVDGTLESTLSGHTDDVLTVSFNHDGTVMASGSEDNTIRIWNVETGENAYSINLGADVNHVDFHPTRQELVSGDENGKIQVWNIGEREETELASIDYSNYGAVNYGAVKSVVYNSDGTLIASSLSGVPNAVPAILPLVTLLRLPTGTEDAGVLIQTSSSSGKNVDSLSFNPLDPSEGDKLLGGGVDSPDKGGIIWDVDVEVNTLGFPATYRSGQEFSVYSVAFSPDGTYFVIGGGQGQGARLSLFQGTESGYTRTDDVSVNTDSFSFVTSLAFSPSEDNLYFAAGITADSNPRVGLYTVNMGTITEMISLSHSDDQNALDFNPDGTRLVTASKDNSIRIWH